MSLTVCKSWMGALLSIGILSACSVSSSDTDPEALNDVTKSAAVQAGAARVLQSQSAKAAALPAPGNPILFVTQVPTPGDVFASRTSTFANHLQSIKASPRGGDLMIRYPDGFLRN